MNGNWASLDMKQLGASTTMASLALTAFWASVTLGRVLFAAIRVRFPTRRTYHLLPFVLAGTFVAIARRCRAVNRDSGCWRSPSPASDARRCCR